MENILIVDDSAETIEIVKDFIDSLGLHCYVACRAKEAKVLIDKEDFGLIICDFEMPEGNGDEVLKHLVNSEKKGIDFVYFTGKFDLLVDTNPPLVHTFNDKSYEKLFAFLLKRYLE